MTIITVYTRIGKYNFIVGPSISHIPLSIEIYIHTHTYKINHTLPFHNSCCYLKKYDNILISSNRVGEGLQTKEVDVNTPPPPSPPSIS